MDKENTISVIVAALNEESRLEPTVQKAVASAKRFFADYEVLIFNDGSVDRTGEIADRLEAGSEKIRAFHHARPRNLGGVFRHGVKQAAMKYLVLINGKNDVTAESLSAIFSLRGKTDLVVPYIQNEKERSLPRRIVSRTFTFLLNICFGMRLRYFNDSVLHLRENLLKIDIRTDSYAFQAEALIKLIKNGCSYVEVGVNNRFEKGVATKAFRWKNVKGVARFFILTMRDVYFPKTK